MRQLEHDGPKDGIALATGALSVRRAALPETLTGCHRAIALCRRLAVAGQGGL